MVPVIPFLKPDVVLRQVLDCLESNLGEYERTVGREPTETTSGDDSLSGFTGRLVNAVNKITLYLREVRGCCERQFCVLICEYT